MIYFPICKINIGLNIIEKRNDGFHNIESVFYPIEFKDALEIRPKIEGVTELTVTGLPIETKSTDDNLCIKAFKLLKNDYPNISEVEIHLNKIIPMGAGLGGGSSNATCTLKLLNYLFSLNLNSEELENYARRIGSDCAFFVKGEPTYAYGKGDEFKPINLSLKGKTIILIKPDIHISTAEAYSNVEAQKPFYDLYDFISNEPLDNWKDFIKNDFEVSLSKKYDIFEKIKKELYNMGAIYSSLSGSGATVYGIFENQLSCNEINQLVYPFVKQITLK